MSNLLFAIRPSPTNPSKYTFSLPVQPDARIPLLDTVNDTGKFVKAILLNKEENLGKSVYGAEGYYTPLDIVEGFNKAFGNAQLDEISGKGEQGEEEKGVKAEYVVMDDEDYRNTLGEKGKNERVKQELWENMKLLENDFGYYNKAELKESLDVSWFCSLIPSW